MDTKGALKIRKEALKDAIRVVFELWEADKAFHLPLKIGTVNATANCSMQISPW